MIERPLRSTEVEHIHMLAFGSTFQRVHVRDPKRPFHVSLKVNGGRTIPLLVLVGSAETTLAATELMRRFWPHVTYDMTVGLDTATGDLYVVTFKVENQVEHWPNGVTQSDHTVMMVWDFLDGWGPNYIRPKCPKEFLTKPHLEAIAAHPEPVSVQVEPAALLSFLDRSTGYLDVLDHVTVELRFGDMHVVVQGDRYQVRTPWRPTGELLRPPS